MSKANWIWYPGDFELYHSMLVHTRRREYEYGFPPMWHVDRPESTCTFYKQICTKEPKEITILSKGNGFIEFMGRRQGGVNTPILFPAGSYEIFVKVQNMDSFPAIFCDQEPLVTDYSWQASLPGIFERLPVGSSPYFSHPTDCPEVFPFSYQILTPRVITRTENGTLYDFGVESFGPVFVQRDISMGRIDIYYGESKEEALDTEYAYLREHLEAGTEPVKLPSKAFRFLYVVAENGCPDIQAELEYLPISDIASFSANDAHLDLIWEISSRAFHLNSREFYLDGIKRDRWVWSGDAYQSYMVNRYLYNDSDITRRTIRALLGRPPYHAHINTINDYSAYMFLAVYEYYFATGDICFIRSIWPHLKALYEFIESRLDEKTGYVVEKPGDWIFIDWARFDREGPLCAEQILLHEVYLSMSKLSAVLGEESSCYQEKAIMLKQRIMQDYWDAKQHAFIDSFSSGNRHVTRHANVFAILYDFVDEKKKKQLTDYVLFNNQIDAITTPYFKLFELMALAKQGYMEEVQNYIKSYWGGMIENGATSAWEEYIPERNGIEHYEMYGDKFGCSLCHAWGSGPILLLGRYCAGVRPTSVGSKTYEVAPQPGKYNRFSATVPIGEGQVKVHYQDGEMRVHSSVEGGTLYFNGQRTEIPVGKTVTLHDKRFNVRDNPKEPPYEVTN